MIFSVDWLHELVDPKMDNQLLMDELTMAGLEVERSIPVARDFSGIVVGEVESVEKHPDADNLSLCLVNDGSRKYQVVCGAPNARAGLKAPFARVGAEIIDDADGKSIKIKPVKIRGIDSNGMLCSAEELGLAESSDGLLELSDDVVIGEDIRSLLNLNDLSIELDLTPNRGDCLSMTGLAREVGVLSRQKVKSVKTENVDAVINAEFPIRITAKDGCPRYLGRIIKNINLRAESPIWMQEKLRRSGLRSIDPIVDVTNYVLMEFGQPMHAFDYSTLDGNIEVRMANEKEKLILLDGKEVELTPDILVIADAKKTLAMAGIMGGLDTSVTEATRDVFLECAFFTPLAIAGKARSYGMHTDASHRYERGVDYQLQHRAMARATQLLLEIVGGEAGPVTEAIGNLPEQVKIELQFSSISSLLGIEIAQDEVIDILSRLGFGITGRTELALDVEVPSFRFDVAIEADLIEELARIYGYNNLPKTPGLGSQPLRSQAEAKVSTSRIRQLLVSLGYQEVVSYSFIDPNLSALVCPQDAAIPLQNPISEEMSLMRTSILPALLSTLSYNENRQQERIRLFESGLVFFLEAADIRQVAMISGLISGYKYPKIWNNNKETCNYYDIKGDVEVLLGLGGNIDAFSFIPAQYGCFHPGQCARVDYDGEPIGHIGALHPAIARKLDLKTAPFLFELQLDAVKSAILPSVQTLSRYPEVSRDLAIVIADSVSADAILALIQDEGGEFLTNLRIFDVYQGDAVTKGKKSIALGLTWQHPSRTLSDEDINTIIGSCVNALYDKFNAKLRS